MFLILITFDTIGANNTYFANIQYTNNTISFIESQKLKDSLSVLTDGKRPRL